MQVVGRGDGEEGLAGTMKTFLGYSASKILTAVAKHLKWDAYEIEFNNSGCYLGFGQLASGSDQLLVDYSSINWVFSSTSIRAFVFGKEHMNALNEMRKHNYKSTLLEDLDEEEREYISGIVLSDMMKHAKTHSLGIWIDNINLFSYAKDDVFISILEKGGSLEKLVIELELEGLLGMEGKEQ